MTVFGPHTCATYIVHTIKLTHIQFRNILTSILMPMTSVYVCNDGPLYFVHFCIQRCITHTCEHSHRSSYDFSIRACCHRTTETPIRILFLFIHFHCFRSIIACDIVECWYSTEPSNLSNNCLSAWFFKSQTLKTNTVESHLIDK